MDIHDLQLFFIKSMLTLRSVDTPNVNILLSGIDKKEEFPF